MNLFTQKGFLIKQKYYVPEEYLIEDEEDDNDTEEEIDEIDEEN